MAGTQLVYNLARDESIRDYIHRAEQAPRHTLSTLFAKRQGPGKGHPLKGYKHQKHILEPRDLWHKHGSGPAKTWTAQFGPFNACEVEYIASELQWDSERKHILSANNQVLVFLQRMHTGNSFETIASNFGIGKSAVRKIFKNVIKQIISKWNCLIAIPTENEIEESYQTLVQRGELYPEYVFAMDVKDYVIPGNSDQYWDLRK